MIRMSSPERGATVYADSRRAECARGEDAPTLQTQEGKGYGLLTVTQVLAQTPERAAPARPRPSSAPIGIPLQDDAIERTSGRAPSSRAMY
eukprot:448577-Pyramimonas_sp.AAC.1